MRIVRKEVRKRGFFGWIFFLVFLAFNAVMAYMTFQMIAAGTVIGFGMMLTVWALGATITGLLAILTKGRKTIVEERYD